MIGATFETAATAAVRMLNLDGATMARAGLKDHMKFKRLVYILREPVPHVWGYLECLWATSYQQRSDQIGDRIDVELAADFPREPGKLVDALIVTGFIDLVEGVHYVHDLVDHAPPYVRRTLKINNPKCNRSNTGRPPVDLNDEFPADESTTGLQGRGKGKGEGREREREREREGKGKGDDLPAMPSRERSSVVTRMQPQPQTVEEVAQLFAFSYTGNNRDYRDAVKITPFFRDIHRRGHPIAAIESRIRDPVRSTNQSTAQFEIWAGFAQPFRAAGRLPAMNATAQLAAEAKGNP